MAITYRVADALGQSVLEVETLAVIYVRRYRYQVSAEEFLMTRKETRVSFVRVRIEICNHVSGRVAGDIRPDFIKIGRNIATRSWYDLAVVA